MKRVRREMEVYWEEMKCECGGCLMGASQFFPSIPPQYPHTCDSCGKQVVLTKSYPRQEMRVKLDGGWVEED